MAEKKEKKGRGRPKWMPPDLDKVESLAASGLTLEQVAHCLGISYDTLNERSKEFSDFAAAIKRGKSKGIGMMANNLVKLAKAGNAAANIFWLKSQAKWREREIEEQLDEEILEEIRKLRKQLSTKNRKEY